MFKTQNQNVRLTDVMLRAKVLFVLCSVRREHLQCHRGFLSNTGEGHWSISPGQLGMFRLGPGCCWSDLDFRQDSHAVLKKYWISKSVFKTLKKYWIWPKCTF